MGGAEIIWQRLPVHTVLNKVAKPTPNIMDMIILPVLLCTNLSKCIFFFVCGVLYCLYKRKKKKTNWKKKQKKNKKKTKISVH
jgi:hypothetical protein